MMKLNHCPHKHLNPDDDGKMDRRRKHGKHSADEEELADPIKNGFQKISTTSQSNSKMSLLTKPTYSHYQPQN